MIPFLKPQLVPHAQYAHYLDEIDEVHWYSNFGPLNSAFERRVCAELFDGIGQAVTVANATLGLMLAIAASRRSGRYALMPSFTFAATALAARWCGLEPWFLDVGKSDWCVSGDTVQSTVDRLDPEVAVVLLYATFGTVMELTAGRELIERGVPVVVDAAPSLGARDVSAHFGRGFPGAVVFSLHATKPFGIGEGALVYSGNGALADSVRRLSNFGFGHEGECLGQGLNAKLPEYSAAVALATLDAYPRKLAPLLALRETYARRFQASGLLDRGWTGQELRGDVPLQYLPVLAPSPDVREAAARRLADKGIGYRTYFAPACHQYREFAACPHDGLFVTNDLATRILSLPAWAGMDEEHVAAVIDALAVT